MKKITCSFTFFFLFFCLNAFGQKVTVQSTVAKAKAVTTADKKSGKNFMIRGKVLDSADHKPLVSATVYVKDSKDSTVLAVGFTDEKGAFTLKGVPKDESSRFMIFYTGYKRYKRILNHVKKDTLKLGTIYLPMNANTLSTVTVVGEKPPIAIKGDTIEFNASSFKTRPNSVLAGLLKKLPGVDVDNSGNITANGKKVDKILVNGKKFFGDDPKIALENLPAAIVDKVQITDTKTRQEELTGEPASGNTETINITLKKGKDHGFFGRAYAGYGTGKHYDASALLNYFEGKRQISLLGAINNINQVGFTIGEIANMIGRNNIRGISINRSGSFGINGLSFGGGGEGIKRTTTAGVNYNDDYGKHFSVNGSYFYGDVKLDNETKTARQNILPDSLFYYNSDDITHSNNFNHRINATINFKDSLWHIYYEPSVAVSNGQGTNKSSAISTGARGEKINESNGLYTNNDQTKQFINRLNIYRTFKKKRQYLYFNFYSSNRNQNGNDYNKYKNTYYKKNTASDSTVDQYIDNQSQNSNYRANFSYSQPFTKTLSMNIGYELRWQHSLTDKKTFDYNNATGKYTEPDTSYSNKFRSNIVTQTPQLGLTFSLDSGRWRLDANADFNFIGLHHYSFTHDISFDQNQFFISPDIDLTRRTKNNARFSLRYSSYVGQPDISQLLPVADNSNPLYIVKGNPNLKPSVNQSLWFNYNKFDFKSGNNIWLSLGYNSTKNDIANVTSYDDKLRQLTTYTNVDGNKSFNLNIDISKTKKKADYHWQVKLGSYGSFGYNHAFVNDVPYTSKSYNMNLRPSVTYGYKELFEFTPSYNLNYQFSKYDIKALRNRQSIMQQGELSGTLYWPKRVTWASDWTYTHNSNVAPGFRKAFWLWNASVSLDLFKKQQATLQFSVYDLLNQNISVHRNITDTYIEDTQTIILHRYFMLKFIYNLRKFGKKEKKKPGPIFFF